MNKSTRDVLFASLFAVAAFAVDAAFSLGLSSYAVSALLDPLFEFTIPLLLVDIGIMLMNSKVGAIELGIISALLYALSFLFFLVPGMVVSGIMMSVLGALLGFRTRKGAVANSTAFSLINGELSLLMGGILLGSSGILKVTNTILILLFPVFLIEGVAMGFLSFSLFSYLVRAGLIKEGNLKGHEQVRETKGTLD